MHHGYLQLHFVCQVTWDSDYGSTVRVAGQLVLQPGPAAEPFFALGPSQDWQLSKSLRNQSSIPK